MTFTRTFAAILLCWLAFWPMALPAQTIPAPLSDTVSDFADALTVEEEARIAAILLRGRAETGVHVAVAVIASRGDHGPPMAIEDFGRAWFNAWGIGDVTRNDGILILVAIADREVRIALGAGYPVVYDGRAQRVIDTAMLPEFRNARYARGIEAGAQAAFDLLARPFVAGQPVTEEDGFPDRGTDPMLWIWGAFIGVIALWTRRSWIADRLLRLRPCPACGRRGLHRHRETLTPPGETTPGQQAIHTACRACGHDSVRMVALPSRAQSSQSGGSGFGGGRSSGGGASGRW